MEIDDRNRSEILKELHNNIWGIIKQFIKVETFIVIFVFIFDLIMIPIAQSIDESFAITVCYLFVLLIGLVFSIYILNNRRIHRQQVEALKNIYKDLDFEKYYPEKTTSMYSRRYDLYLVFVIISTCCTLLISFFI